MMKTLAVIASILLAACGDETASDAVAAPAAPAQFDATALAAHSLMVNSLPQMQLLATASGRDVMARVVSCALPRGASLTAITREGTPYSFTGDAGLAPDWVQRPATSGERHRVTDCVLGHPSDAIAPTTAPTLATATFNRA
jgi:hypothetical protein